MSSLFAVKMTSFLSFLPSPVKKDFSSFCLFNKTRAGGGGARTEFGEVFVKNSKVLLSRESFPFLSLSFPHTASLCSSPSSSLSFVPSSLSSPYNGNTVASRFLRRRFFSLHCQANSSSFSCSPLKTSSSLSFSSSSHPCLPAPSSISFSPTRSTSSSFSLSSSGVHTPYHYLSSPRYSFFFSGYSTPQSPQKKARGISVTFVAVVFLMPTICVYFGSSPSLLNWWMNSYRLVEYFPQADRRIIPAIFHGKTPPSKSEDSDIHTNR